MVCCPCRPCRERQLGQRSQYYTGGCVEKEQLEGSWKGAAVQRGLEPGTRRIVIVRSRYQATTSADIVIWETLCVIL
jgi:hypothetical protein